MSRLALAALATAALLTACAPMPPAAPTPSTAAAAPPPAAGSGDWVEAERQARASGHSADSDERRPGGRALRRFPRPRLRRLASEPARDAGRRIARPAPARRRSIASRRRWASSSRSPISPSRCRSASYEPLTGDSIVFERSTGGNEASQIYRLDLASKQVTRRYRAGHAARPGRLAAPQQPAALLLGAARPHRQRRDGATRSRRR